MINLAKLQEVLGVPFQDMSFLEQSLIHSSYLNEPPGYKAGSNERLEFLGDAVLNFLIAEALYLEFPDFTEGQMTQARSRIVCRDGLARMAKSIRLGEYLYLGKGEEASGGRDKPANLEATMEAVIAAILLDRGLDITREFILKFFRNEIRKAVNKDTETNYKSRLQEIMQSNQQQAPTYRLVEATGPDHDRMFTVEVLVDDSVIGTGAGKSKKMAEAEAARSALGQLPQDFTQ